MAVFFRLYTTHASSYGRAVVGRPSGLPDSSRSGSPTLSFACPPSFGDERAGIHSRGCVMSTVKPSSVPPSTPDYTDPAFSGALTSDHWSLDDTPELSKIPSSLIADVSRASNAIETIARIVHNSLCEPEMHDAEPLGYSAHLGLLDAAELIGKHLADIAVRMNEAAQIYAELDSAEVHHD